MSQLKDEHSAVYACMQEGVREPIHIMSQPDFLTARVLALEDVEVYVEDLEFARVLCEETLAVKRESPMQVSNGRAFPPRACASKSISV